MNQNQYEWTWKSENNKLVLYDRPEGGEVIAGPFSNWEEAQRDPKIQELTALWRNQLRNLTVRTLFHFIYLNKVYGEYWVRIPAWDSNLAVRITDAQMTPEVRAKIAVDYRCHGIVNLNAKTYEDLEININED